MKRVKLGLGSPTRGAFLCPPRCLCEAGQLTSGGPAAASFTTGHDLTYLGVLSLVARPPVPGSGLGFRGHSRASDGPTRVPWDMRPLCWPTGSPAGSFSPSRWSGSGFPSRRSAGSLTPGLTLTQGSQWGLQQATWLAPLSRQESDTESETGLGWTPKGIAHISQPSR